MAVGFGPREVYLIAEYPRDPARDAAPTPTPHGAPQTAPTRSPTNLPPSVDHYVVVVRLGGARLAEPVPLDPLPGVSSYFIGEGPDAWRAGIAHFGRIAYAGVGDGVELDFEATAAGLKYNLLALPGASPSAVSFTFDGASGLTLSPDGGLVIHTPLGDLRDDPPTARTDAGAGVRCGYAMRGPLTVEFACEGWDGASALRIDPLVYSTYLGGGLGDTLSGMAVDGQGQVYITGYTWSSYGSIQSFPTTPGAWQSTATYAGRVFVSKFSTNGTALVYSTIVGGSSTGGDFGYDIAVDASGGAHVVGHTWSVDFPITAGAFKTSSGSTYGTRGFITKLAPNGTALGYSSYIGGNGSQSDAATGVAVDAEGNAYVTGTAVTPDFPSTAGAYLSSRTCRFGNYCDAPFALKVNVSGDRLLYSTFLTPDGGYYEPARAIALTAAGEATIVGSAYSPTFPSTAGAYDTTPEINGDGFVLRLSASGSSLVFATFFGGTASDEFWGLAVARDNTTTAVGATYSTDLPIPASGYDRGFSGPRDAFAARFRADGSALLGATYLGGSGGEIAYDAEVDASNDILVVGATNSSNYPATQGTFQANLTGPQDGFVAKLNATLAVLYYGTFFGGNETDEIAGVGLDGQGRAYFAGSTNSDDLPTTAGAFSTTYSGSAGSGYNSWDAFAFKMVGALAPRNLSAAPGSQMARLQWSPPSSTGSTPVAVYRVYGGTDSLNLTKLAEVAGNRSAYNQTGLTDGTQYFFRLSAVTGINESALTGLVNATPRSPPSEPVSLATSSGDAFVNLSWSTPTSNGSYPILGYTVRRGPYLAGLSFLANVTNLSSPSANLSFNDTTVTNGVRYDYTVAAWNLAGEGPSTARASALPWAPPTAPLNVSATTGDRIINLSWAPPASLGGGTLTAYRLYRGPPGGPWYPYRTLSAAAFSDTNVTNGLAFSYTVSAVTQFAEGAPTAELIAVPAAPPGPPRALAASIAPSQVTLNWTAPLDDGGLPIVEYRIFRANGSGAAEFMGNTSGDTSFVDASVANGVSYAYYVTALNERGEGGPSNSVTARPIGPPAAPDQFAVTPIDGGLELSWSAPLSDGGLPLVGYVVYRGPAADSVVVLANLSVVVGYTDMNVSVGRTYFYAVAAQTGYGLGAPSMTLDASPLNRPPAIAGSPPSSIDPGTNRSFAFGATDPDGELIFTFTLLESPPWVNLSEAGVLVLSPAVGIHGTFAYRISVRDGFGGEAAADFTIRVTNKVPVFDVSWCGVPISGTAGSAQIVDLTNHIADPDDYKTSLHFQVLGATRPTAAVAVFDANSTLWVAFEEPGSVNATLVATDPAGESANCALQITTLPPPPPPPPPTPPISPVPAGLPVFAIVAVLAAASAGATLALLRRRRRR